jgi:HEAT repeat protein
MSESAQKAVDALEKLLEAPEPGFRLEAARELLKYEAYRN